MRDRDRLIDIMARATARWRWGDAIDDLHGWRLVAHDRWMVARAIDAAEAVGFVIVPPDDGR
jgi:hypothetical protein